MNHTTIQQPPRDLTAGVLRRLTQIPCFVIETLEPLALRRPANGAGCLVGKLEVVGEVAVPQRLLLPTFAQLLAGILSNGFEQDEARLIAVVVLCEQAFVDQRGDPVEDLVLLQPIARADCLDRFQSRTAGKHAQPAKEVLLAEGQQIIAPGNCPAQRLLPCR